MISQTVFFLNRTDINKSALIQNEGIHSLQFNVKAYSHSTTTTKTKYLIHFVIFSVRHAHTHSKLTAQLENRIQRENSPDTHLFSSENKETPKIGKKTIYIVANQ